MNQIPKTDIFKAPEGYFETFPERALRTKKIQSRQVFITRIASAAVMVAAAVTLFILKQPPINEAAMQTVMDQEVEFYINSGYWNAEDVLGFSENPDELLDMIIAEEWSSYHINDNQIENEIWY